MVAVSPAPADVHLALLPVRRSVRLLHAVARWVRRLTGRLPGQFTIAKLDAFNRFRQQATPLQQAQALVLSPLPSLIFNVLIESIPLADPARGFKGSLHFQLRHLVAGMTVATLPVFVKFDSIPELPTRSWKFALGYGLALGSAEIGTNALISVVAGVFPVPFAQFAPALPLAVVGGALNHLFLQTPETRERPEKIDQWAAMDAVPIFVYPVFTALFMTLKPSQQLWASLLLPAMKHVLREVIWRVFKDDLDLVGATTCVIGHFYHVLFTAMCLQNAKSPETLTAIVLVNTLQMALNCRDILKDADALDRARKQLAQFAVVAKADIVSAALNFAKDEHVARRLHRKKPSRRYQGRDFMDNAASAGPMMTRNSLQNSNHRGLFSAKSQSKQATASIQLEITKVSPFARLLPDTSRAQTLQPRAGRSHQKEVFAHHVTSALHQAEIILLRSYITINVLLCYGIYLLAVFRLPNRQYFATMTTMTSRPAVNDLLRHLLQLGCMEVVFMVVYLVLIWRRLGVSGVHQLPFVLWSQRILLQSKFLTLTLMILGFPLGHYGNGIIFRLRSG